MAILESDIAALLCMCLYQKFRKICFTCTHIFRDVLRVTVVGDEISDLSSSIGRRCIFLRGYILGKGINPFNPHKQQGHKIAFEKI